MAATDPAPTDETTAVGMEPPAVNDQGFAMAGAYPLNFRLRAEALSQAGKTTDPDGLVDDAAIEDAGKRLAADAAARDANPATAAPSLSMTRDQLVEAAEARGLTVAPNDTKATILDAITAADAANGS